MAIVGEFVENPGTGEYLGHENMRGTIHGNNMKQEGTLQSSAVPRRPPWTLSLGQVSNENWNLRRLLNKLHLNILCTQEYSQGRFRDDYHRVARECNKYLTIALIFGPLLSIVFRVLINEASFQLQPQSLDENTTIRRILINKITNTIFGNNMPTLPPRTSSPYAMYQVLFILCAGNAALVSFTILAIIGNQCFLFYNSNNWRGPAVERDQDRQQGLKTSVEWYFNHLSELLPLTLHVSLLLFGCAFFRYLWESHITTISFFKSVVIFTVIFYLFFRWTTPERCPVYQTPCTNIIHHISRHLLPALRSAPSSSVFIQTSFCCYAFTKWIFYVRFYYPVDGFKNTLLYAFCPLPFVLLTHPYLLAQSMLPCTIALAYNRYVGTSSPKAPGLGAIGLHLYAFLGGFINRIDSTITEGLEQLLAVPTRPPFQTLLCLMFKRVSAVYTRFFSWDSDASVSRLAPSYTHDTTVTTISEGAYNRLIKNAFNPNELTSLVEVVFSSDEEVRMVQHLCTEDAQTFVNVIHQALETSDLSPQIQRRCLKALCDTCHRKSLLPSSLLLPLCYDRQGFPLYSGGFADVWKGKHKDRDVAVKVIRVPAVEDRPRITGTFCKETVAWKALRHPNVLPLLGVIMNDCHLAMVSEWMENGNINEFLKGNPKADRLGLLVDVARGVTYIHSQGMIHGDLKGNNILVDSSGHACVADFSLLTILSGSLNVSPSSSNSQTPGGTARWMSPELIDPEICGLTTIRRTKLSDSYALGMVIYETISGYLPFHNHADLKVFVKVLEGKRPPRGAGFTDSVWRLLEKCWEPDPAARPSVEEVLRCLENVLSSHEIPGVEEESEDDGDDDDDNLEG